MKVTLKYFIEEANQEQLYKICAMNGLYFSKTAKISTIRKMCLDALENNLLN